MGDKYNVIISLEHQIPLYHSDKYLEIVQRYESRIVYGSDDTEVLVGTFEFYVINVGLAINLRFDIVDVADSFDQDLYNYCETLFQPGTIAELRADIVKQFGYPVGNRLLVLHLARVLPEHRGKHLALVAAHRIIEQFGDGLVIARAQPLQHHEGYSNEKAMRYESFERVPATALKRLEKHWRRVGFAPIGKTGYLGLNTAEVQPEPKLVLAKKDQPGQKKPTRGNARNPRPAE